MKAAILAVAAVSAGAFGYHHYSNQTKVTLTVRPYTQEHVPATVKDCRWDEEKVYTRNGFNCFNEDNKWVGQGTQ